jgi:hypothetical protein
MDAQAVLTSVQAAWFKEAKAHFGHPVPLIAAYGGGLALLFFAGFGISLVVPGYSKLSKQDKINWCNRLVAAVHAVIMSVLAAK